EDCTNPAKMGTKSCLHYRLTIQPGESAVVRLRLTPKKLRAPLRDVDTTVRQRRSEADDFYAAIHPPLATPDEREVQRQALAGLLWSKQIYLFDVDRWLEGDAANGAPGRAPDLARNI